MNSSNDAWLDALVTSSGRGETSVLVTVVAARGSAPRAAGAKMAVSRDVIAGTIGGGHLELQAIEIARGMLFGAQDDTAAGAVKRFPLGAALGQCCGGSVDLLFEPVPARADWLRRVHDAHASARPCVLVSAAAGANPGKRIVFSDGADGSLGSTRLDEAATVAARELLASGDATVRRVGSEQGSAVLFFDPIRAVSFNIVLFGAGHVGRALVRALTGVPCRITWVDDRALEFPPGLPSNVRAVVTDAPDEQIDAAPAGSFFLVMTYSHALDQALAERILGRGDFAYFGLIGSSTKRRLFERRMAARGVPKDRFARMKCPIGVHGINGKEPAVIALAVAAELLQVREAQAQRSNGTVQRSA
jgi:xanthine dehydrogenase accessory factor